MYHQGFLLRMILVCVISTIPSLAMGRDIAWQRHVDGYLNGLRMAVYHGGMEFTKPVFVDTDNDGDEDLYVGEHDGYLNVFLNLGGNPPEWSCVTTSLDSIDVGKQNAPAFWDIDLDGDLDLFIGDEEGDVWYYHNVGSITSPVWNLVTEYYIAPLLVDHHAIPFFSDLDADGDDDLLIGHNEGGAAHFLNVGTPGFPFWSLQTEFYQGFDVGDKSSVCVFDVDDNNLGDIFMGGVDGGIYYFHNDGPDTIPVYTNMGVLFDVGDNGVPTFCDLDYDGDLDLVVGESFGNLNVFLNEGTPTIPEWRYDSPHLAYYDAGFKSMPALVDIDTDGDLDLFVSKMQNGIAFFENIGSPDSAAWQLVSETYAGINPPRMEPPAFYDLDNDGDQDFVVGGFDGSLTYYQNVGTPQSPAWREPEYNYTGTDVGDYSAPAFADADSDGDADLFIGSFEGTLRYLRNDGTPSAPQWQDLGNYPGIDVGNYSTPAFADLDADGDLDILVGNGNLTGVLTLYRNDGSPMLPSWTLETPFYQAWDFGDYSSPCFGDIDGNDDIDLLVGCEAGGLWLWENVGWLFNMNISLLPYDPPIVIPPEGGSYQFVLMLENLENSALQVIAWTTITRPDGQTTGAIDSLEINLEPGVYSDLLTHDIPGAWPSGVYQVNGYVGLNSVIVYGMDSFDFEKSDTVAVQDPGAGRMNSIHTFNLHEPYPNPFNRSTEIVFSIPAPSNVEAVVFDLTGREVTRLFDGWQQVGTYRLNFVPDGLASGIYFIQLKAGDWVAVKKVAYLR